MFPLSLLKLQEKILKDDAVATALSRDISDLLFEEIEERTKNQSNLLVEIWGEQGSGKSYLALSLSSFFPERKVFWRKDDIIQNLSSLKENTCVILDEQVAEWGLGSFRISLEYETLLETLRKRQISFIHASPTSKILSLCHLGIETLYVDRKKQVTHALLYDRQGSPLGRIQVQHPKTFLGDEFIQEYEREKDKFLDVILHKDGKDSIIERAKVFLQSKQWADDLRRWKRKNRDKPVAAWFLEQSVSAFYPHLKRNIEVVEIVNCVKYLLE